MSENVFLSVRQKKEDRKTVREVPKNSSLSMSENRTSSNSKGPDKTIIRANIFRVSVIQKKYIVFCLERNDRLFFGTHVLANENQLVLRKNEPIVCFCLSCCQRSCRAVIELKMHNNKFNDEIKKSNTDHVEPDFLYLQRKTMDVEEKKHKYKEWDKIKNEINVIEVESENCDKKKQDPMKKKADQNINQNPPFEFNIPKTRQNNNMDTENLKKIKDQENNFYVNYSSMSSMISNLSTDKKIKDDVLGETEQISKYSECKENDFIKKLDKYQNTVSARSTDDNIFPNFNSAKITLLNIFLTEEERKDMKLFEELKKRLNIQKIEKKEIYGDGILQNAFSFLFKFFERYKERPLFKTLIYYFKKVLIKQRQKQFTKCLHRIVNNNSKNNVLILSGHGFCLKDFFFNLTQKGELKKNLREEYNDIKNCSKGDIYKEGGYGIISGDLFDEVLCKCKCIEKNLFVVGLQCNGRDWLESKKFENGCKLFYGSLDKYEEKDHSFEEKMKKILLDLLKLVNAGKQEELSPEHPLILEYKQLTEIVFKKKEKKGWVNDIKCLDVVNEIVVLFRDHYDVIN